MCTWEVQHYSKCCVLLEQAFFTSIIDVKSCLTA